jgi:hypothetical protein
VSNLFAPVLEMGRKIYDMFEEKGGEKYKIWAPLV